MDTSIEQLSRDLALAKYAKSTRERYIAAAKQLAAFRGKPLATLTRDDLRAFVEARMSSGASAAVLNGDLCGVLFLFRRTLGRPELVSFIKLPRRRSPLPAVLSLDEVNALLRAIREPACGSTKPWPWKSATSTAPAGSSRCATARATRRARRS
jgi:site-specific recombinase XerD